MRVEQSQFEQFTPTQYVAIFELICPIKRIVLSYAVLVCFHRGRECTSDPVHRPGVDGGEKQ
jgi:hypothetical protein